MQFLRRHKSVLIALGIYWPVIFWLTHIPVPDIAWQSGMSDKTMHVMAYFVLTFLIWFAVSPYHKVKWNQKKVWGLLAVVIWYGAMDEYLQGRVGRSADVMDFVADFFGMVLALGVLSLMSFWTALLTASAVFVFVVSNMSNLLMLRPEYYLNTVFHFTAYTAFALIWIQHMDQHTNLKTGKAKWLWSSLAVPAALLLLIKGTSPIFDRDVWWVDLATAMFGVSSAILISWLVFRVSRKTQKTGPK